MNETDRQAAIAKYLEEVTEQFYSGHAIEHAYRPALKVLMSTFDDTLAVNDPKHSEHGAPDFVFLKKSNQKIIKGYAEAKDITVSLDKTEKTDQMTRYGGYANLFLTDYLEFRFFKNGEKYQTISLGHVEGGKLYKTPENGEQLIRELEAFLQQTPEKIRSGKRLAEIMGGKARRIRDNVKIYLTQDDERNTEIVKIYEMMKKMLVHDLSEEKFADMYAQTLVYGLFVARYGDKTPDTFSRSEARDLVPKSNPFLRHFFDHIVGPDFDTRLGYIVDELCEIFLVSNVNEIVHKHLRIADDTTDVKDSIIHFYEDFLQEYDPKIRKEMGAYYTPIPVVQFIVRQVDKILKEDFGIARGLASDETFMAKVDQGQTLHVRNQQTGRMQKTNLVDKTFHRVQVLDPAVGTATFLNETIKHIHKSFIGQEGRWASYVNDNLLKRLYGFELMMAPYTIAHLKLGMTLQETGVDKLNEGLNVFLTNTLEEGIPLQSSLFDFGLAGAVSEESRLAAEVKSEKPVMVVMGNPPYSVSSNNKSEWIQNLIADYKKDLHEKKINLDDDYIKFIRFAEEMIAKNGEGIVGMITNNSYIDGITHRQMRKHLLETFDAIYILDLHGNIREEERGPDGQLEENVFETIRQGVSIVLMVKSDHVLNKGVYFSEVFGKRKQKYQILNEDISFDQVEAASPNYFFTNKDLTNFDAYNKLISVDKLFKQKSTGIETQDDNTLLADTKDQLIAKLEAAKNDNKKYSQYLSQQEISDDKVTKIRHKVFDDRYTYLDSKVLGRARLPFMRLLSEHDNFALCTTRQLTAKEEPGAILVDIPAAHKSFSANDKTIMYPLYNYYDDGDSLPNLDESVVGDLMRGLTISSNIDKLVPLRYINMCITPDYSRAITFRERYGNVYPINILDYVYAVLHSPQYRKKYKEFLRIDFPHITRPDNGEHFWKLVNFGSELRRLHLMQDIIIEESDKISLYGPGNCDVEKLFLDNDGKIWINESQYFSNVPEIAWNLYIGGYQPAQKWLKARRGHILSSQDIDHFEKIIKILSETSRIMKQTDQ